MDEYSNFKVQPNLVPLEPARSGNSESMMQIPGEQLEKYGDAAQKAGAQTEDSALMMQEAVNQVKVLDARNQAMQEANNLRFNTETGFSRLKGNDALQPINGQAMPDYYAQQLNEKMQQIGAGLTNPMQQRMFAQHSGEIMTGFRADAESHMMSEFSNFHKSAVTGAQGMAVDDAISHADNPVLHEKALQDVRKYASMMSQFDGSSALEMAEKAEDAVGAVRLKTITNMRDAGNVQGMNDYYATHHDDFGVHKLDAQNVVNEANFNIEALGAGLQWSQKESERVNPTSFGAYQDALFNVESGGKDYNPDGTPVRGGQKLDKDGNVISAPTNTGKYKSQVLDSTAANPGYGIKPAKDGSPEEYNRVGQELLKVAMKKFPDKDMVTAAYHDGIDTVEKAIASAARDAKLGLAADWQKYISPAARAEIVAVDKRMAANLTAQPMKSKEQANAEAIAALGPNPSTILVQKTIEQVDKFYGQLKADQSQRGDQLWGKMQQQLLNSNGDMSVLDPIDRQNLAVLNPGASLSIERFASTLARGGTQTIDTAAFSDVYSHPDKYRSMTQNQLTDFLMTHFPKQEQEKIIEMLNHKPAQEDNPQAFNETAFKDIVDRHLQDIGIDKDTKDPVKTDRISAIKTKLINGIYEQQHNSGKRMQPDEMEKYITGQFAKTAEIGKTFFGDVIKKPLIEMTTTDIPDEIKTSISSLLVKNGIPKPTDEQILGAYLHWKGNK